MTLNEFVSIPCPLWTENDSKTVPFVLINERNVTSFNSCGLVNAMFNSKV